MFSLKGKTALVTGAASGIGEAAALSLAQSGAFVYVADIDESNGAQVVDAIEGRGGKAAFLKLDVSDTYQCRQAEETVSEQMRHVDVLVNNAGLGHVGTILETTSAD